MVNMYYSKCKPIQEVETLESYFRKYDELQNEFDELDREFTTLIPGHLEYFLDFSNPELFEGMEEGSARKYKRFLLERYGDLVPVTGITKKERMKRLRNVIKKQYDWQRRSDELSSRSPLR